MRRSDLVQNDQRNSADRTTQIVFGERQHLLRVLDSLEGSQLPPARRNHERRVLEELIHARTKELNEVNSSWDEKVGMVLSAEASPDQLEKLARAGAQDRFLPAAAHQRASAGFPRRLLSRLARHPYGAIRENVARHPNADAPTLAWLSRDRSQPLWYLVAFNPNTPSALRRKLQDRLRKLGETAGTKYGACFMGARLAGC